MDSLFLTGMDLTSTIHLRTVGTIHYGQSPWPDFMPRVASQIVPVFAQVIKAAPMVGVSITVYAVVPPEAVALLVVPIAPAVETVTPPTRFFVVWLAGTPLEPAAQPVTVAPGARPWPLIQSFTAAL